MSSCSIHCLTFRVSTCNPDSPRWISTCLVSAWLLGLVKELLSCTIWKRGPVFIFLKVTRSVLRLVVSLQTVGDWSLSLLKKVLCWYGKLVPVSLASSTQELRHVKGTEDQSRSKRSPSMLVTKVCLQRYNFKWDRHLTPSQISSANMSVAGTLEFVRFEWTAERSVKLKIRDSTLTFST